MSRSARWMLLIFPVAILALVALSMTFRHHANQNGAKRLTVNYLNDIRNGKYEQAYERLCPGSGLISSDKFVGNLRHAAARNHGLLTFGVRPSFAKETLNLKAARATVKFADGVLTEFYYERGPNLVSRECLLAFDDFTDGQRDISH